MIKLVYIIISRNAQEVLKLVELVAKKHQELGNTSLLKPLGWDTQAENIGEALELHKQAKEYKCLAEQAHKQPKILLTSLDDLLKVLYHTWPKTLYGCRFTIDDAVHKKKKKK